MTEFELLVDLHKDEKRQGPGSSSETKKALNLIGIDKNENLKIADIGCGSGAQTIVLAQNTNGQITAVDLFPEFLEKLDNEVKILGLDNRIKTLKSSMDDLPFDSEEFDIIWSEGAIYNIGFEKGIQEWRKFLKTGGYIAVSEISWITNSRPKEVDEYWIDAYKEIDTVYNKIAIIENCGYQLVGHFILPQYCWIDNYYEPIQKRFNSFLDKHNNSEMAKEIVELEKKEIKLYKKFKDYYSYGFYIAKKK
jgi:ubiquinone/menaquinone biosynthesis C-methylase UbiE